MYTDWQSKFGLQLGKNVVKLTGETSADLKLLAKVCVKGMVTCFRLGRGVGGFWFFHDKIYLSPPLKLCNILLPPPHPPTLWQLIGGQFSIVLLPPLILC